MRAQLAGHGPKKKRKKKRGARSWEALAVPESASASFPAEDEAYDDALEQELLRASQQEYLCVRSPGAAGCCHADQHPQGCTTRNWP